MVAPGVAVELPHVSKDGEPGEAPIGLALQKHPLAVGVDLNGAHRPVAKEEVGKEPSPSASEEMKRASWLGVQLTAPFMGVQGRLSIVDTSQPLALHQRLNRFVEQAEDLRVPEPLIGHRCVGIAQTLEGVADGAQVCKEGEGEAHKTIFFAKRCKAGIASAIVR